MKVAMLKDRRSASGEPDRDDPPGHLTVIGGGASAEADVWPHGALHPSAPSRNGAPIVRLPVGRGRAPAPPRVVAEADLHVKRFHGHRAGGKRYTATLHAASAAPAALLTALADAAREIDDFTRESAADDHLILTIAIRR